MPVFIGDPDTGSSSSAVNLGRALYGGGPDNFRYSSFETGFVYRDAEELFYRYPSTQQMANLFPGYMKGRQDKYSYYQQLLNVFGKQVDEQKIALTRHLKNKFPQTFLHDTIDVIYTIPMPSTYKGVQINSDTNTQTEIFPSKYNDYESWWYDSPPTIARIIPGGERPYVGLSKTQIKHRLLPIEDFEPINYPTRLFFILHADTTVSFIKKIKNEAFEPTQIIIHGIDEFDQEREEKIEFRYATLKQTLNVWKEIYFIDCIYWDDPSKITITVTNYIPSDLEYIEEPFYQYIDSDRNIKPMFWKIDRTSSIVQLITFAANNLIDKEGGVSDFDVIAEYVLWNFDDKMHIDPNMILWPSQYDDKLYVWSVDRIYIYKKFDLFSNLAKQASAIQSDNPIVDLSVDQDHENQLLKITANFNRDRFNTKIKKYRFSIIKDDVRYNYINDAWTTDDLYNDYPFNSFGFASPIIEINYDFTYDNGAIIIIDIIGDNGIKYSDTYIVDNYKKFPISYVLTNLNDGSAHGLTAFENNVLGIVNGEEFIKIIPITSDYLVDSDHSRLILTTQQPVQFIYEHHVEPNEWKIPQPFNVFNELDQWGEILSVKRFLGEKNTSYIKRLRESSFKTPKSNLIGVLYGMSRDLNQSITDSMQITAENNPNIVIEHPYIKYNNNSLNLFSYSSDEINAEITGTMEDVKAWLEFVGAADNITVTVLDEDSMSLPIRFLVPYNNISNHFNENWSGSTFIQPHISADSKIITSSVQIDGFTKVDTIENLNKAIDPSYFVGNDFISVNRKLTSNSKVHYQIISNKIVLKISQISIYSVSLESNNIKQNYISDFIKDLMNHIESKFPTKWTN